MIARDAFSPVRAAAERALAIDDLRLLHATCPAELGGAEFFAWALQALDVEVSCDSRDLARVPAQGPAIVTSNHPFGGVEGLALAKLLMQVRPDVRILANAMLASIPQLAPLLITVDPFGGAEATRSNLRGVREALRWLGSGGMLLTFPAGEVAHLDLRRLRVCDPPWNPAIARLAVRSGASLVPAHVPGRNGAAFQAAGLLHPRLRTALLPRALLKGRGTTLRARFGSAVDPQRLATLGDDRAMIDHLRWRSELLSARDERAARASARPTRPVAEAVAADALAREIEALPPECVLVPGDDECALIVQGDRAPLVLREIGRLREIAFRAAGEGTGRETDLDRFDTTYRHLFAWSRSRREILGAYRIGAADELLRSGGRDALYTSTLFDVGDELLENMGPSLELGRSFVRLEHQRSPSGLLLLWRGLGALACREPHRPVLFGAVSISAAYGKTSRLLIQSFLSCRHGDSAQRVRPRHGAPEARAWDRDVAALGDLDEVSRLVEQADPEGKGVPVLVRQYVKLGAKVLGFNVDPAFSDALDALIVVDLRRAPRKLLERFMGKTGAAAFMSHHGANA